MFAMSNLKLWQKLVIPATVMLVASALTMVFAKNWLDRIDSSVAEIVRVDAARLDVALTISDDITKNSVIQRDLRSADKLADATKFVDQANALRAETEKLVAQLPQLMVTDEQRKIGKEMQEAYRQSADYSNANMVAKIDSLKGGKAMPEAGVGRTIRVRVEAALNDLVALSKARMSQVEAETLDTSRSSATRLALAAGIGQGAALLLLAWIAISQLSRPLGGIARLMERLAAHDTGIAVVGTERKDEVGTLARSLQVFKDNIIAADRLAEERRQEQDAKLQRQTELETLIENFERTAIGIAQSVADAASATRQSAESLAASAEESTQRSQTVATASGEATANVQTVASAAEELSMSITEISRQVRDASSVSDTAVQQAQSTSDTLRGLAQAGVTIGEVVQLINSIAGQTNLLALNATIEAARAGEAGKGFAIVAAEVKNLASQTAKATEDIQAQVASIQSETDKSVTAIAGVGSIIGKLNDITASVAAAVEQQGAATADIARNVQQAATGTQRVSANIAGVTEAASETGEAARAALKSADALTRQADLLREELARFVGAARAA